ncbi:hypothetical protein GOODEAATRI_027900 [Goodea atripinnis]|uniref:RING-type domain-containing protein n=1 Tax=Goodea atripinnis TaxID=208336 RepID=A0ABV0PSA2_9TELE
MFCPIRVHASKNAFGIELCLYCCSVLCEDFVSRRAEMSCGHAVTPMSLTKWCLQLLEDCPGCKSSVARRSEFDLSVSCEACTAKKGQLYEFCWQCLREWKGPKLRLDRCENDGCSNTVLQTLKTCPEIVFDTVKGITGCPSIRACPTCGSLLEHKRNHCKHLDCPHCKVKFCFVCLKTFAQCSKTSSISALCSTGVAPRQSVIPVWKKK